MVPGELYFMIKIPEPTSFTSYEKGKKTGAILNKPTLKKKKNQRQVLLAAKTRKIPSICQQSRGPLCLKLSASLKHITIKRSCLNQMQRTSCQFEFKHWVCFVACTLSDIVKQGRRPLAVRQWGGEESLFQCNGRILVNMLSVFNDQWCNSWF